MMATIDRSGRVVIPAEVRKRLGLTPGTELNLVIEGRALRLIRAVAGPDLSERRGRLVASPRAAEANRTEIDVAKIIEEERERWPV
jgi:antitoxin PrlF